MQKTLAAFIMGAFLVGNTYAQDTNDQWVNIWGFGGGFRNSCATWLSTERNRALGNEWIGGYWSGQNAENEANHMVGSASDAAGILAEIELICREEPSQLLASAAGRVYVRFEEQGR